MNDQFTCERCGRTVPEDQARFLLLGVKDIARCPDHVTLEDEEHSVYWRVRREVTSTFNDNPDGFVHWLLGVLVEYVQDRCAVDALDAAFDGERSP